MMRYVTAAISIAIRGYYYLRVLWYYFQHTKGGKLGEVNPRNGRVKGSLSLRNLTENGFELSLGLKIYRNIRSIPKEISTSLVSLI